MPSHEVDYEIFGDDMQIVEIELDPGETIVAEAGAMNYMEDGITFETRLGDGSKADEGLIGKLLNVGKRMLTGESIFLTHFTNSGHGKKRVAFAAQLDPHVGAGGGSGHEALATGAGDRRLGVLGVDVGLHHVSSAFRLFG